MPMPTKTAQAHLFEERTCPQWCTAYNRSALWDSLYLARPVSRGAGTFVRGAYGVSGSAGTFVLRHRDGTRSAHSRPQPATAGDFGTRQKRIKQPRERASLSSNPLVLTNVREYFQRISCFKSSFLLSKKSIFKSSSWAATADYIFA